MIAKALRGLRIKAGLSREELAALCGLSRDAIISYENGRRKPDFDAIVKLEKVLNTTAAELAGSDFAPDLSSVNIRSVLAGKYKRLIELFANANRQAQETAMLILEKGQKRNSTDQPHENQHAEGWPKVSVPVVGKAAAGLPIEMIEEHDNMTTVEDPQIQYGDFAVIADGDSMIDAGIQNGDRVIIRPQPTVENGELALIAIEDGSTIKRFYKTNGGYRLVPANASHDEQYYPKTARIRILGKVIKTIRYTKTAR